MYHHIVAQPEVHGFDEGWEQRPLDQVQATGLSFALGLAASRVREAMERAQSENVKRRRQAAKKRLDAGSAP
eukprot:2438811-Alexandrium_andersonii.AAC.1